MGNFYKPTARADFASPVLAVHWVRVRSSKRTPPARDGFKKFPMLALGASSFMRLCRGIQSSVAA